ncbi:MAG TPA: FAD-dependent monooxygenase, partial [Burkholderiales bacterium]
MPEAGVIVIGGGPVGLGLAVELGQAEVPTLVLERNLVPSPIPKGQNLTQRTLEHFHFWRAEDALRDAQSIPASQGQGGLTAYGSLLSGIHYDWLQRDLVGDYYYTRNGRLPQYATERVLRERVAELPHVMFKPGWRVVSVVQDEDGVAVVARQEGADICRTFHAEFAVDCDGSHSLVREAAGIGQSLDDRNRLMALVLFRSQGLNALLERFPGKSFFNVLAPALEGYWQFFGRVDL